MKRNITAMMVCGLFLIGLPAWCGGTNEKGPGGKSESGADKLVVWGSWDGMADILDEQGNAPYWQAYQEATNTEIEFIDTTGGKEALSVLISTMSTGDMPDIIIEYDFNIPTGLQQSLLDETIIPLNGPMDAGYMPNFTAYLEGDPDVDKLIKNDDGLYAWAPMIRAADSPLVFGGNMVRQDWMDELGLNTPTTIREMEDVLIAFRDKKGAGAGYSFAWTNYGIMVQAYGIIEAMYVDEDGQVQYGCLKDNYKDFLTTFNRWYEEGILDPDGFTQNIDAFNAKVASGQTGYVFGWTGGQLGKFEQMKKEYPEMDFQPVPQPVMKKGGSFPFDVSAYRVNNIGAMITSTCKNVEAAARFIDYVYGEEGIMLSNWGKEGKTFEYVNGEPVFTDFVLDNPDGLSGQQALSLYAGYKNKSFITLFQLYPLDVQQKSLEVWSTPDAKVKALPPLAMTADETDEYSSIMMDVQTYIDENKLLFIYGSKSLDEFDEFRDNLEQMGIERAIEITQAAYDRFISR